MNDNNWGGRRTGAGRKPGGTNPNAGRKPTGIRRVSLCISLQPEELEEIRMIAKSKNVNVSRLILDCVLYKKDNENE